MNQPAQPTPEPTPVTDPSAALAERAALGASQGKLAALLGQDFSWSTAMGGWRGAIESILPGAVFVIVYLVTGSLMPPLFAAAGTALVLAVIRLAQRTAATQVLTGLIGVAFGFWWARTSGRAEGYYGPALLINAVYLVVCGASIVVRWPLVGIIVGAVRMDLRSWRNDLTLYRRCRTGTWLLAAMFALRLAVKVPLYFFGQVGWLGIAHIALGIPLYALTLYLIWLLVRNHVKD